MNEPLVVSMDEKRPYVRRQAPDKGIGASVRDNGHEAAAAALWTFPAISKSASNRPVLPSNVNVSFNGAP